MRKSVFGVIDQVRHKLGCIANVDDYRLEISDLGGKGLALSHNVAKTKKIISCAVTTQRNWAADQHLLFSHICVKAGFLMMWLTLLKTYH